MVSWRGIENLTRRYRDMAKRVETTGRFGQSSGSRLLDEI